LLPDHLRRIGQDKAAAVLLIQGMLLNYQDEQGWPQLSAIYASANGVAPPLIIVEGNQSRLNLEHPQIQADLGEALTHLVELSLRNKDIVSAERGREAALGFGCDVGPIDELMKRLGPKGKPWRPKK
jgi:hypothetical protein